MPEQAALNALLAEAKSHGAHDAQALPASALVVRPEFARLCGPENACPNYGLAPTCPPHALRPGDFQALVNRTIRVLAYKIDAPITALAGPERVEIARKIHHIAAALTRLASKQKIFIPHAFAAGSCKELFCADFSHCPVLTEHAPCRHHLPVFPSLSAVGADFAALARTAGWDYGRENTKNAVQPGDRVRTGLLAGFVLLGRNRKQ